MHVLRCVLMRSRRQPYLERINLISFRAFRFGLVPFFRRRMTRLVVIHSLNHLVRILALIILRIREGASYSTAFRCLTGRKLIDVLRSYGVKSIVHLANIRPEVLRIHDGLAVRIDGRHSEFSESGPFQHDKLTRRCYFSYTTEQLISQYRALQERERAKTAKDESKSVEGAVVHDAEMENGEKDESAAAAALAEEPRIAEEDSDNRIAEDVASVVEDVLEMVEMIEESDRVDDISARVVDEVLRQIELERINGIAAPEVVNLHQKNVEGISESVGPGTDTIELTAESMDDSITPLEINGPPNGSDERIVEDISLVVAEMVEVIEEADRSELDDTPVEAEVLEQIDIERIDDIAAPEENDVLEMGEERLFTSGDDVDSAEVRVVLEYEEERIDDVIAPVEFEVLQNAEEERIVDDAVASLEADDLLIAVIYRVELASPLEADAFLREHKRLKDVTSVESRDENRFDDSFTSAHLKVNVEEEKFFLPNGSLSPLRSGVQRDLDMESLSTIPSDPSLHYSPISPSDIRGSSGTGVLQSEYTLNYLPSLVHHLGPNIHDFDEIRGTNERLAIMTFMYDLDVFYIRPLSHQSYYDVFTEGLLRTHKQIAEEQKKLWESEKHVMRNKWAIGDFACYVHIEKKRVPMWYDIPKTDKPLMWYELLELEKEDKAYRVRILSARFGIEGMEYDLYSLDCGFIARGVPYENLVKIDSNYLRFNTERSIWMPEPLCTPCTRRPYHKMSFLHECHFTLPPSIFPREIDTEIAMTELEDDTPLGFSLVDMQRRNIIL